MSEGRQLCSCGALLTEEELHYYEHSCEKCEQEYMRKMEADRKLKEAKGYGFVRYD